MHTTTTPSQPPKRIDPAAAFKAVMDSGRALRRHGVVVGETSNGQPPTTITREKWYAAASNLLKSSVLDKDQQSKLKGLRDELRRTKVKA